MSKLGFSVLLVLMPAFVGCSDGDPSKASPDMESKPAARVRVYRDGRITLDDHPATIEDLRSALTRLRGARGPVLYYREAGREEPPPIAMEVIKAIADAGLSVSLSTKPDFSDFVGTDGQPRARR